MLLLSIKPKYVQKILTGEKCVELRRRKPRSRPGDWLAIYESSPTMALVAITRIKEVKVNSPRYLWRSVGEGAGISKQEFSEYFAGTDQAVAILIETPSELRSPIPLSDLRAAWPRFNPPQGFLYLSEAQRRFVTDQFARCSTRKR